MSEPSAYELERLANMAANQRQLEAMGLVEAADACREPSPPKKQPKKRKKAQPKRELPKRHSTRANGGSENLLALEAEISKEEREKRAAQSALRSADSSVIRSNHLSEAPSCVG